MALTPVDLIAYLVSEGIGTAATDLFYGSLLESPDALICLQPYGGAADEVVLGSRVVNVEWPFVHVIARGVANDWAGPAQKIQDVRTAFTKVGDQLINGTMYHSIMAIQPPFPLRQDKNFRWEHICNFRIMKDYSAS